MIAYNTTWLKNLLVLEQADEALAEECVTKEENERVFGSHPAGFYTPNFFVRIGLFILTVVIALFTLGIFLLAFMSGNEGQIGGLIVFLGLLAYAGLEIMVSKRHYKSGVDDALMWLSPVGIVGGFNIMSNFSWLQNAIMIFILAFFLFYRFINMIVAGIAGAALIAVVFLTFIRFGEIAKVLAPFVVMITSALIYMLVNQLLKKEKYKLYADGLLVISFIALLSFYVGGNYFAVRETSIAMFRLNLSEGQSIPLGWVFWIFTLTIPAIYMVRGIQKKDIFLMRTGLILVAAIVFTVRYYYHVMPVEIAAVIAGGVLVGIAYVLITYLREPKYGFTYKKERDPFLMDKLQVESLIIAQTFTGTNQPADSGVQFGGGSGGGAGACGEF